MCLTQNVEDVQTCLIFQEYPTHADMSGIAVCLLVVIFISEDGEGRLILALKNALRMIFQSAS